MTKQKNAIFTVANLVTTIRIFLIPVFVVVLLAPWPQFFPYWQSLGQYKPWFAAAVFAVLAMTDGVDGYLARSRDEVTTLGKFLDPIADKILVCAALLALCELGTLPSWIALVIVARDFIISGLRMVASSEGIVIAASWFGKAKTAVTIVAILLFIVKDSTLIHAQGHAFATGFQVFSWIIMMVAVLLTVLSMVDYFAKAEVQLHLFTPYHDGEDHRSDDEIASKVLDLARSTNCRIATAESCTGGLLAAKLTDIPGSSDVFMGCAVSYANVIKEEVLGVSKNDLMEYGAVSPQVAEQMATGVLERFSSDVGVSVTGVAGPGGGTDDKPVGTVWFGVSNRGDTKSIVFHFDGERSDIRKQSVHEGLLLMESALSQTQLSPLTENK